MSSTPVKQKSSNKSTKKSSASSENQKLRDEIKDLKELNQSLLEDAEDLRVINQALLDEVDSLYEEFVEEPGIIEEVFGDLFETKNGRILH